MGGGRGTGKGTGKSMRKLCRNYPLANYPVISPLLYPALPCIGATTAKGVLFNCAQMSCVVGGEAQRNML